MTCVVHRAHRTGAGRLVHTVVRCTSTQAARARTRMTLRQRGHVLASRSASGRSTVLRANAIKSGAYTMTVTHRVGKRSVSYVHRYVAG
jgi:hypothetical protein